MGHSALADDSADHAAMTDRVRDIKITTLRCGA
jgi:hypothetical protein